MKNSNTDTTSYEVEVVPKVIESPRKSGRLFSNAKYFSIAMYLLFVVVIGLIAWKLIDEWSIIYDHFLNALSILAPFFIGAFMAFLLSPLVKYFRDIFFTKYIKIKNLRVKTALAILFTYLLFFGLVIVLLAYIIPQLIQSLKDLALQLPTWYAKIEEFILTFGAKHPELNLDYNKVIDQLENADLIQNLIDKLSNLIPNLLTFVFNTSVTIIKFVINLLISIMVSVYMLAGKNELAHTFKRVIYSLFPKKVTYAIIDVIKETNSIFSGFIFGKAIDSLIIGIICFILMKIFNFDYALLISVCVGITNMIPYFGPYMGGAFGILLLLIVNPLKAVFFFIMIIALQQFDGLFLGPKILGKSMGMKPIWIIFSITVGGSLFGIMGMFLGVPIFAVISYILNKIIDARLAKKKIRLDETDTNLLHHFTEE